MTVVLIYDTKLLISYHRGIAAAIVISPRQLAPYEKGERKVL